MENLLGLDKIKNPPATTQAADTTAHTLAADKVQDNNVRKIKNL